MCIFFKAKLAHFKQESRYEHKWRIWSRGLLRMKCGFSLKHLLDELKIWKTAFWMNRKAYILNAVGNLWAGSKPKRSMLHCCIRRTAKWLGGWGNFETHHLIEPFPKALEGVSYFHSSDSTSQILFLCHTLFMFWVCICCFAGGWKEEDADEIWIISSQCLAEPHFAGTTAFQCNSPPTQQASCRPRIWLLTPPPPSPSFNQIHTHSQTSLSIHPHDKTPPPPVSAAAALCRKCWLLKI